MRSFITCILHSRRIKRARHIAQIEEKRKAYIGYWWENQRKRNH
jgi:hypothetical protein